MIAYNLDPVQRAGQMVKEPAQRIRHRLGFVMVIEAGEIAPAGIAPDLDQAGAEFDSKEEPAKHPDDDQRGRHPCRPEEDREKSGFEEKRLPAEGIEGLTDVDDRQVK